MAKVLLVEDDNNLREIYEARLQAEGYEIVSASDGEQALAVAKDTKPDLVISDVMMPKISGFEMLDILRNTDGMKDVKVIMLTALGQAEDKTRADQLGANRYLVKSQVTLEDIVKSAHQLLDDEPLPSEPPVSDAAPVETPPVAVPPVSPEVITTSAPAPAITPTTDEPASPTVATPTEPASTPVLAAAADDDAETAAQEQADMAAQINSFVESTQAAPVTEEVAAAVPTVTTVEPAPAETAAPASEPVVTPTATTADNDKTMSDAIDSLAAAAAQRPSEVTAIEVAPEPSAPQTPPTPLQTQTPAEPATTDVTAEPDEAQTTGDGTTVAHKKIITPISDLDSPKPDITALLAAEEAKEAGLPDLSAAPTAAPVPESSTQETTDPALQLSPELQAATVHPVDPDAVPAVQPAPPVVPPTEQPPSPNPAPAPSAGSDPNSIAL